MRGTILMSPFSHVNIMQKHIHCSQENPQGKSQGFRLRDWVSYLSCQLGFLSALSSIESQQCFPLPWREAWEMLKVFGSRHFLKGCWDSRLNSQGFTDQIPPPPNSGTKQRPWVGALVPAQPKWKVSTTRCYLRLNKSNFGKMHNEFSSWAFGDAPWRKWIHLHCQSVTQEQELSGPDLEEGHTGLLRSWELIGL